MRTWGESWGESWGDSWGEEELYEGVARPMDFVFSSVYMAHSLPYFVRRTKPLADEPDPSELEEMQQMYATYLDAMSLRA